MKLFLLEKTDTSTSIVHFTTTSVAGNPLKTLCNALDTYLNEGVVAGLFMSDGMVDEDALRVFAKMGLCDEDDEIGLRMDTVVVPIETYEAMHVRFGVRQ